MPRSVSRPNPVQSLPKATGAIKHHGPASASEIWARPTDLAQLLDRWTRVPNAGSPIASAHRRNSGAAIRVIVKPWQRV